MSVPDTWVTFDAEDIGNTFGPKGRRRFESACLVVEGAEIVVDESDDPNPVADLFDTAIAAVRRDKAKPCCRQRPLRPERN